MIKLTEKAIYDFIHCSLYYYVKHVLAIAIHKENRVKAAVHQCTKYFYSNLLNGKVKTYKELQQKWDSLSNHFESKEILTGWAKMLNIASWTEENKLVIGDINCDYVYTYSTVSVSGTIDYILVYDSNKIEILYFDLGEKKPNLIEHQHKLKYALDYYGFKHLYGSPPARIRIHNVKHNEDIFLTFMDADESRLNVSIYHIAKCIEHGLYYPRENYMCDSCSGKGYCRYFSERTLL